MMDSTERYAFDALHPFSFITDERGAIQVIGRSLHKILPQVKIGAHFCEAFTVVQPPLVHPDPTPQDILGELLVLTSTVSEHVKLRGQVAPYSAAPSRFIFAVELSISSPSDVTTLNLSITDFRMADPIFDFLLFMQGQTLNQKRLRQAKESLEWKNRITNLLLSIALSTEEADNEESVYRTALDAVCAAFEWDVGHVLLPSEEDPSVLVSSGLWHMNDRERYAAFYADTLSRSFKKGEGIPGRVLERGEVVWVTDEDKEIKLPRRESLATMKAVTGAGVPVFAGETVVAVLEFFKADATYDAAGLIRFFRLLSIQLSSVIARQRAEVEARRHLAGLANASKMATLGEIAAGVAHEINNPLHTLTLTSHLLQRLSDNGQLTKEVLQTQLDKVETCVQRMATIVAELKAFSRDSTHDDFKGIPLRRLVAETLDLCHARLLSKDVRVRLSDIPESWETECRPSQISQVILNLFNNAYDATVGQSERWIRLDIQDKGEAFEISVTDSGPGVAKEVARKMMDPFFTTKPPGKGTGLGLSISSNIMTDHGGALYLDQTSPHTRFVMTVPKVQGAAIGRRMVCQDRRVA
jgi:signal transduction histidine kinase